MIVKQYGVDFSYDATFSASCEALTLQAGEVCENHQDQTGYSERRHDDGWLIKGEIMEDYYYWVNEFEAEHEIYGKVWGDFEGKVYADTEEGFAHFYEHHTPESWDYWDI